MIEEDEEEEEGSEIGIDLSAARELASVRNVFYYVPFVSAKIKSGAEEARG